MNTKTFLNTTAVFFIYLLIGALLTWPLVLNLSSTLFGDFGDTRGGIWLLWADIHGLRSLPTIDFIAAPFGFNNTQTLHQPVLETLLVYSAKMFGEIAGYNIIVMLAFPLTAFTTYLFLDYLLQSRMAAFIGGLIFGFCPGTVLQAVGGHMNFSLNLFIPLFLLALFFNRDNRKLLSAFFVALSYAFLTLNSLYFGYFAIFIAFSFIAFDYITHRDRNIKQFVLNYLYIVGIAIALIVPFQYRIILEQLTTSSANLVKAGHIRDFSDLTTYSARPLEYFLPSIDHPVAGNFFERYFREHLHGSNIPEQTLYMGLIPVLLCVLGLFLWPRKDAKETLYPYFLYFCASALWLVFLSLPPFISLGALKIPTLSFFAYKLAPMFRVYARFGILANLFIACAAATVLAMMSDRMKKTSYLLILGLLMPLLLFEYWSIPHHHARAIDSPPEVYTWLAKQQGDFIIAEYPMMSRSEASFYTYLFWQRIHKKRMINGASPDNVPAWDFFERVRDLTDPDTPRLLKSIGVKYIIVHAKMYEEGPIPGPLKRYLPPEASTQTYNMSETFTEGILNAPYKSFGQDLVFAL